MTVQDWFANVIGAIGNIFQGFVTAIQNLFGCGNPPV